MSLVSFKKGLLANLPSAKVEGTFYVTTDERAIYLDVDGSTRVRLGDFQEFATLAALQANTNPSTTALYYVDDINCLAKWSGTEYIQINRDTGMTSVEVVGDGNAVTVAAYDAAGRKLTLTKGATYMTASDVDSKISAKVGDIGTDTVKKYVDDKTSGIASDAALSELSGRVTTAESDIDALEAKVGEKTVDAQIDDKIAALKLAETYDAKGAADAAKSAVIGAAADLSTADTIKGAKKHADEAVAAEKSRAEAAEAQALTDAKAYADAEDKKIEDTIGTVTAGKTVVQMIEDAKTAATYDDTALSGRVTANEQAITKLNGASTVEGSVDYKIAQAVAKIMENPDETMNSINELVTWCNAHATEALALTNKVNANEADITALEGLVGSTAVATQITNAIADALKIEGVDKYALATDLTAAIARIAALEGDTHTHANKTELDKIATGDKAKWDAAEGNAKAYADGLAVNYDAAGSADAAEQAAKDYADGKIAALDKADAEMAGQYVSAVSETDGIITVSRKALPDYSETYDAKGAAAQALTDANEYTDTALTWGSF